MPISASTVPCGSQWAYEMKHDGFRFVCRRDGDQVRVLSRRGNDLTERVPAVVAALQALPVTSVTLDSEGMVCGPDGVSDFDLLRAALGRKGARSAFLYAFDVLELDGRDLRPERWKARRDALTRLLSETERGILLSDHRMRPTARLCSGTPALWGSRASSPSGGLGHIVRVARRTGLRSRTRRHQQLEW